MSTEIAKTLAEIFQCDGFTFDEAGCATHKLPSNQVVEMRWLDEDSALLVALPLGALNAELEEIRAFMLLIGNRAPQFTGGGAFGLDRETREVYLSRIFPVSLSAPNLQDALGALGPFCLAGETARAYFGTVNEAQPNDELDGFNFPGVPVEEVEAIADEMEADAAAMEFGTNEAYLAEYSAFLGEAIQSLGLKFEGVDEDHSLCITGDNEDLIAQIRFDRSMGEIILTTAVGEFDDEAILEMAVELLADNLFLEVTGNCVLGISDADPCAVFLTMAVTMEGLVPEATNFANLIGGFLQNAEFWCESLGERTNSNSLPPPPPVAGMQNFV